MYAGARPPMCWALSEGPRRTAPPAPRTAAPRPPHMGGGRPGQYIDNIYRQYLYTLLINTLFYILNN